MSSSNTDTDITICAACGKEGDNLKACTACHLVKYCNRDCQISHRKQHKKECKKRAAELYDEKLFKDPPPPEDCPICFLILPHESNAMKTFNSCCGKVICNGCIYAMEMSGEKDLCPFCRTPPPLGSNEEEHRRIKELMDKENAVAFFTYAFYYEHGLMGNAQNWAKAKELYLKAGELGCADGYYNLGISYRNGNGVDMDMRRAKHYYELAAMMGHVSARNNLGCIEGQAGNHHRAMRHMFIAAKAGDKNSLDSIKQGFQKGWVTKGEYADTLRAHQKIQDGMKSDERDRAASELEMQD